MADYNINAITRRVVFTGSAGVGPYAFSFEVLDENDVAVYFNTTKLTLTTDYTVTVNANGTGSVTIVTGTNVPSTPTASDTIIIIGSRDIERVTDFVTAGDLLASSLNEQLDALTIFDQQISEEGKRSMRAPVYDPALVEDGGTLDMTLPPKADRVDTVMAFDTNGNPVKGPTVSGITTITELAADITTLADIEDGTVATDAISDTAAIASDVTTVAGISANVTTVAGNTSNINAVAADATDIGTVATNIASVNTVATNIADVITVANDLNEAISEVETVADDLNEAVSEIDTVATNIADVQTVGTDLAGSNTIGTVATNIADVNTVATNIADVSTTASNIAGVNSFAERYRVGATDPTTSLDEGDLFFNTTSNQYKFYDGSAWQAVNVSGLGNIVEDTSPQLGGNLDVQTNSIVSTSNQDINITPNGTGSVVLDGLSYPQADGTAGQFLKTDGAGQLAFDTVSTDLVDDTTPQLGGNLDLNSSDITGTGDINITGTVTATSFSGDGSSLTNISDSSFTRDSSDPSGTSNKALGDVWINTSTGESYVCIDATTNNNVWINIGDGSGSINSAYSADYLVIAGGGAGGGDNGGGAGGGGAGGYRASYSGETSGGGGSSESSLSFDIGVTYTITVGAGGSAGSLYQAGGKGTNSSVSGSGITTVTSQGGSGGSGYASASTTGGSGGGGCGNGGNGPTSGTANQGFAGGTGGGGGSTAGGGGGGAGAVGQNVSGNNGGDGGAGVASTITGSSVTRAGGGGAGQDARAAGSVGLGAAGGGNGTSGGAGNPATANTGSGGGGSGYSPASYLGGTGGSGVVILRVPTSRYSGTTTGSPTVTTDGTDTILTYNSSGTYVG